MPPKMEIRVLMRYLYSRVHWSIIYDRKELEAPPVSSGGWTDKENVIHAWNGIFTHSLKRKKFRHTVQHGWILRTWMLEYNKPVTKRQSCIISLMRPSAWPDSKGQKVEWWLSVSWGMRSRELFTGCRVSVFSNMKRALETVQQYEYTYDYWTEHLKCLIR